MLEQFLDGTIFNLPTQNPVNEEQTMLSMRL